jgi:DNA-binding Lrp family transcriptional regulator
MDELDRRVIAALQADPRISYAALGKQLGVSGMTAATRLNRLRASGALQCRAEPNLAQLGLVTEVLGFIQADMATLQAVIEILRASHYVLEVDRVTGEFDLSFRAAFRSEVALGALVRELQDVEGLRRLMVHHVLERVRDSDGWEAVFAEPALLDEEEFELASGAQVPKQLEPKVQLAAAWVDALAKADLARLRSLSDPDVVFTILPPHGSAGTFEGLAAVEQQAERTRRAYRRLWYRIVSVTEAQEPPYSVVIDALSPVETQRGRVGTAFSRMAFAIENGRISRVISLGQMELPEVPRAVAEV